MIQRTWRAYGLAGHRQAASFGRSIDPAYEGGRVHVSIRNADKTGTNEYSEVQISAETAEDCEHGLDAQLNDGSFFSRTAVSAAFTRYRHGTSRQRTSSRSATSC